MSSSKSLTQQKNSTKIEIEFEEVEEVEEVKPKKMITRSSESKTPISSREHNKILSENAVLITNIKFLNYQIKTLKDKMKVARIALDEN